MEMGKKSKFGNHGVKQLSSLVVCLFYFTVTEFFTYVGSWPKVISWITSTSTLKEICRMS